MSEAIQIIQARIDEHRKEAEREEANAENYEKLAKNHRTAARIYRDLIAELEQSKHDLERAASKRTPTG